MNDEQLAALTPPQRDMVTSLRDGLHSRDVKLPAQTILYYLSELADAHLEVARLTEERDTARAETRELGEKGYKASVWAWHKDLERLTRTIAVLRALVAEKDKALEMIHTRATPRSQDFLHPTKAFADGIARLAHDACALSEEEMRKRLEEKP